MDDVIEKILELLEAQLGTIYNKYVYGEDLIPPQKQFPFIEVDANDTEIDNRGTGGTKDNQFSVTIRIKDTLKATLDEDTNKETFSAKKIMVQRMEKRVNNIFANTSVMYVLANNLKLGGVANIVGQWSINYSRILPLNGSYVIVGSVTFNVNLLSYV